MLYVRSDVNLAVNDKGKRARIYLGGSVIPEGVLTPEKAATLLAEGVLTETPVAVSPAQENLPVVPFDLTKHGVSSTTNREAHSRLRAAKNAIPAPDEPELDDASIQSHFENADD